MRILHLTPFFAPVIGGLERVVYELCTRMAARGHDVSVWTSDLARTGRVGERVSRIDGVIVHRSRALVRLGAHASLWPSFVRTLAKGRFDIVHAHSYRHPHCDLASLRSVRGSAKFVLDPHWPAYPRSPVQSVLVRAYDATLGRRLIRSADAVLVGTPAEVPWLVAQGARRVEVLPHGIPDGWLSCPPDGQRFREEHGLDGLVVLAVGRIDESKGFHFVVEALAQLPELSFVIIGPPGPFYPALLRTIKAHGVEARVKILGLVSEDEKIRALDGCDVFIQPSLFEAFGVSTLEAMARGKACIGSRVGGLAWLLEDSGLLVAPGNVQEIADALRLLARDDVARRSIGAAARHKAEGLTWGNIVDRYERFLTHLLDD